MDTFDNSAIDHDAQESSDALAEERRERPPVEPFDPYFGRRKSRSWATWTAAFTELTGADEAA